MASELKSYNLKSESGFVKTVSNFLDMIIPADQQTEIGGELFYECILLITGQHPKLQKLSLTQSSIEK